MVIRAERKAFTLDRGIKVEDIATILGSEDCGNSAVVRAARLVGNDAWQFVEHHVEVSDHGC